MNITLEEKTLIALYTEEAPDREQVVSSMRAALPHVEEPDIRDTMTGILEKVQGMTQKDFAKVDLSETLK